MEDLERQVGGMRQKTTTRERHAQRGDYKEDVTLTRSLQPLLTPLLIVATLSPSASLPQREPQGLDSTTYFTPSTKLS